LRAASVGGASQGRLAAEAARLAIGCSVPLRPKGLIDFGGQFDDQPIVLQCHIDQAVASLWVGFAHRPFPELNRKLAVMRAAFDIRQGRLGHCLWPGKVRAGTVSLRCEPPFAARRDEGRFCFYGGDEKCPQVQLWAQV